jgi:hypothetical protein
VDSITVNELYRRHLADTTSVTLAAIQRLNLTTHHVEYVAMSEESTWEVEADCKRMW